MTNPKKKVAPVTKRAVAVPEVAAPQPRVFKTAVVSISVPPGFTDEELGQATARTLTRPETNAAGVIESWQKDTHDVNALADVIRSEIKAVNAGDLSRAEGLLIAQAHALDHVFTNLARRANNQTQLLQWETYMRMAMKAQNQCRMTLESLATIKNPPAVFAKQVNLNGSGNQQVNNGPAASAPSAHAEEKPLSESKLLAPPSAGLTTGLFSKPQRKSAGAQLARPGRGKS